jgi:hypothetical protein
MPAFTRRQYAGAAAATTITAGINPSDTTCSLAATTGWPSTAAVPFYVVIDPGTSAEEKCSATISGSTLTLTRAQDDTSATSHSSGATIYPVFTANDADEANEVVSKLTTKGDLLVTTGSALNRLAVGTNAHVLTADSAATNGVKWALSPETDLVTTKGDILAATAADTLARLPVGINSYRVTAASGETSGLKYDMPSIPVFATTATRDAAFGGAGEKVLAEGQTCYIEAAPNRLQIYDGATWRPVDVEMTAFTPTVTAATGSLTTASATANYCVIGKIMFMRFSVTITTNGTGGQAIRMTSPLTCVTTAGGQSFGIARDVTVTGNTINVYTNTSTSFELVGVSNAYPGANGVVLAGFLMTEVA